MNDCVTWKDVYELLERFRVDILTEMRAQRHDFTSWQAEHEKFHRDERKGAWRAAGAVAGLSLTLGGLVMAIVERLT